MCLPVLRGLLSCHSLQGCLKTGMMTTSWTKLSPDLSKTLPCLSGSGSTYSKLTRTPLHHHHVVATPLQWALALKLKKGWSVKSHCAVALVSTTWTEVGRRLSTLHFNIKYGGMHWGFTSTPMKLLRQYNLGGILPSQPFLTQKMLFGTMPVLYSSRNMFSTMWTRSWVLGPW